MAACCFQPAADNESRIHASFSQYAGNQAGGCGFAVRASHSDALLESHKLGQHQGARHYRDFIGSSCCYFRVIVTHCSRDDNHICRTKIFLRMPLVDLCAKFCQPLGRAVIGNIRAADAEAKIDQHLGNTAHTGAANADKMHGFDFMFHSAASIHILATAVVASGLPKARAFCAMSNNFSRVNPARIFSRAGTLNSFC